MHQLNYVQYAMIKKLLNLFNLMVLVINYILLQKMDCCVFGFLKKLKGFIRNIFINKHILYLFLKNIKLLSLLLKKKSSFWTLLVIIIQLKLLIIKLKLQTSKFHLMRKFQQQPQTLMNRKMLKQKFIKQTLQHLKYMKFIFFYKYIYILYHISI